ncbi:MAG: DUF2334 domain-containing protein, partial [Thermoplasmata archaeon]
CEETIHGKKMHFDPLIPPSFRGEEKNFSVIQNEKLCLFLHRLRTERKADVMQHGFTHGRIDERAEFEHSSESFLKSILLKGDSILKKGGFSPNVFVPPYERLSPSGWRAVSAHFEFMYTAGRVRVTPLHPLPFHRLSLPELLRELRSRDAMNPFLSIYRKFLILRNWGTCFDLELEPEESLSSAIEKLNRDVRNDNPSVWVSHYWEWFFDWSDELVYKDHLEKWNEFLEYALSLPIWQTTVSEMMQWRKAWNGLKTIQTMGKLKMKAGDFIPPGLTVIGEGRLQSTSPPIEREMGRIVLGKITKGERVQVGIS